LLIKVTADRIDPFEAMQALGVQGSGAVVTFTGIVRDTEEDRGIRALYYEHYPGVTEKIIEGIVREALKKYGASDGMVIHRIGTVEAGEASVFIAVSAERRSNAFSACENIIDRIKEEATIWKKDIGEKERWHSERDG